METDFDPYRVLGVPIGADEKTIRRRYRQLVRKHHPDVSADSRKAHERFVRIQRAYELLMDPVERARWERRATFGTSTASDVSVSPPGTQFEQLIADSRRLLRQGSLRQARNTVARAIELNPFDADAYRLLGDIYIAGGNMEMGLEMYREAELMGGRPTVHRERPDDPIPEAPPARPRGIRVSVLAVAFVGAAIALGFMVATPFEGSPWPFAAWGIAAAFLATAGGVGSGAVEPLDELLGFSDIRQPGKGSAPGGLYVLVVSVVHPLAGLAFFAISSALTETFTRGILKVYAVTFVVWLTGAQCSGWHSAFYWPAASIAFSAALAGWLAGSFFTPNEWWCE